MDFKQFQSVSMGFEGCRVPDAFLFVPLFVRVFFCVCGCCSVSRVACLAFVRMMIMRMVLLMLQMMLILMLLMIKLLVLMTLWISIISSIKSTIRMIVNR